MGATEETLFRYSLQYTDMSFYETIVENQIDLISRFNAHNILTYVNPAFCKYAAAPKELLVGQSFMSMVLAEDRAVIDACLATLTSQKPSDTVQFRVSRHGKIFWQEWALTFIYDANGNFVEGIAVGRDITRRKSLELDLQASSQTLSSFFSLAPVMMGILNMQAQVLRINAQFERTLGYSLSELNAQAQAPLTLFAANDLAILTQIWESVTIDGETYTSEVQTTTKSGAQRLVRWRFSADVSEGLVFCIGEDITEERQLADAKVTDDAQFKAIVDNMPGCAVYTNLQFEITMVNKSFITSFGYSTAEIIGQQPDLLYASPEDYAGPSQKAQQLVKNPNAVFASDSLRCQSKNGDTFSAETRVRGVMDPNGILIGFLFFIIDESRIHEELQGLNRALEQRVTDRTEEMQAFVSKLTHDFRSPLRSIGNFAMFLEQDHGETIGAEGRSFITAIRNNAGYMDRLVKDLLEFSKVRYGAEYDFAHINLQPFIATIALRSDASNLGTVTLASNLPVIQADPSLLEQAITNLVDNAAKYVADHVEPKIHIDVVETERHWGIRVTDNGIGIAPENQRRIFTMFERVKGLNTRYEGTGIGLAIVKSVAEIHNGFVSLDSEVGVGSVFTLFIDKSL